MTFGKDEKVYIIHSETMDTSKSFTNKPLSWYFNSVLQHLFSIYILEFLVGDVASNKKLFLDRGSQTEEFGKIAVFKKL